MNLLHMCSKGDQKARVQGGEFSEENIEPPKMQICNVYCDNVPIDKKNGENPSGRNEENMDF